MKWAAVTPVQAEWAVLTPLDSAEYTFSGASWLPTATVAGQIVRKRNNVISFRLFERGIRLSDLSVLSRVLLWVGDVELDSDDLPGHFEWQAYSDEGGHLLVISLGAFELPLGMQPVALAWTKTADLSSGLLLETENVLRVQVRDAGVGYTVLPDGFVEPLDYLDFRGDDGGVYRFRIVVSEDGESYETRIEKQ